MVDQYRVFSKRLTMRLLQGRYGLISSVLSRDKRTSGDTTTMDRAYIDYESFEQMTQRGMIYITKMNKNGLVENCHIPQYKEVKISRRRIENCINRTHCVYRDIYGCG